MDLNQFLRQRQPRWQQLSAYLDRIDKSGVGNLSPQEADTFYTLYRHVSSDLNLVQTRTGNPALLEYLEGLVARAYACVTVPRRVQPFRHWWTILRHRFPAAMRSNAGLLLLSASVMTAGMLFGFIATQLDPSRSDIFISAFPGHLTESPRQRVERLEAMERDGASQVTSVDNHAVFSTYLFTHNIRVTVLGFALGFTFGVGTLILLFYNGIILGSLASLYWSDGVIVFFLAWVGPHGSVELPCILFGCTAGLMLARAQFRRDDGSLRQQLRNIRPQLTHILIGTATFLVLAGLIEGGFSQVNEPTLPYWFKISVATALFLALVFYLFRMPVAEKD